MMKRKFVAFTASLLLLLSMLLTSGANAHLVTLVDPNTGLYDRNRQEWFGTQYHEPPDAGTGMIQRDAAKRGEFVFNDAVKDHRVITTATNELTKSTDLDWFAITGDTSYIYFLAKMDSIKSTVADPVPELMVSIDAASGGNTALPASVGVNVASAAAWEYVVQTDFTKTPTTGNTQPPKLWTSLAAPSACTGCQAQLVSASPGGGQPGSFIEMRVPWTLVGGKPALGQSRRFTATIYRKDHQHPNDGFSSALIDAASTKNTIEILSQDAATINTYFNLYFDANGEVFSPLLISEFLPNPPGSDDTSQTASEWIELYSTLPASCGNACNLNLSAYKLGDAAHKGGPGEAMLQFPPNKTLVPGGVAIVARLTGQIGPVSGSPLLIKQNTMSRYLAWASGTNIGLDNQRDQIVLLDGSDTIVDLVEYTTEGNPNPPFINSTPLVFPAGGAPESNMISYERCPAFNDTNNTAFDFLTHDGGANGNPTPGVPCPPATGVDLRISKVASAPQLLAGSTVTYFIDWSNFGGNLTSVVVSDTLPSEISFVSQSPGGGVFTPSAGPGQPMFWTFTFPSTTTNVSGTILLTARLRADAPVNRPFLNTAEVREQDPLRSEDPSKLANNTSSAEVTAIRPDLGISTNWPGAGQQNANVDFTINYNNHGEGEASDVIISDTLPANVTFLGSSPGPDISSTATRKVWKFSSLLAGDTGSIIVHVKINAGVAGNTPLVNNVVITGDPADASGTTLDNSETKTLTVGSFKVLVPLIIR